MPASRSTPMRDFLLGHDTLFFILFRPDLLRCAISEPGGRRRRYRVFGGSLRHPGSFPWNLLVVAWKDVNSNGTLDAGDFYGFYANDLGQPLGVTLSEGETVSVEFVVAVYSGDGGSGITGMIQGTATLAQGLTGDLGGAVASIYTPYDNWNNDNNLERIPVSGNGTTVTFTFSNVDPGTYYLDVWKDNDNSGT